MTLQIQSRTPASVGTPLVGIDVFSDSTDNYTPKYRDQTGKLRGFGAAGAYEILVTSNPYSNLAVDGVTDDTAALLALYAAAPDGSILRWPAAASTMVLTAAAVIPAGKHFRHLFGGKNGKTTILQTSPTADHFTVSDWYSTFENGHFASINTTTTGSQALTSGQVLNVAAIPNLANVAASGSITVGSTAGWQVLTYSARTSTTVTLSQTGTGSTVAGVPLVFKTAGTAINAGNNVGVDMLDCSGTCLFNGYVAQGSTANVMRVDRNDLQNTINFGWQFDGANLNGYFNENKADCTVNSRTLCHLEINQCGSLIGGHNFLIRGQYNHRLGSTTAAYPAGVFSVDLVDSSFDNAGIDCVKFQGISAIQRVRYGGCGFTSAQGGKGINLASTASTLPTGITVDNCDVFSCSADGIGGNGAQDLTICGGTQIAGNANAGVNSFVPRLYIGPSVRIGPIAGIGANGTGIILPAGAYTTVQIQGNDLSGNTTAAMTDSSTSIATRRITENVGLPIARINLAATAIPLTTVTNCDSNGGLAIPAGFRPLKVRITVDVLNAAVVQTPTATLRFGTANSNADAAIATLALAAGTAVLGSGQFVFEFEMLSSVLAQGLIKWANGNNATGVSTAKQDSAGSPSPGATISTAAAAFLGVYLSSATAAAITVRSVAYEILSQ